MSNFILHNFTVRHFRAVDQYVTKCGMVDWTRQLNPVKWSVRYPVHELVCLSSTSVKCHVDTFIVISFLFVCSYLSVLSFHGPRCLSLIKIDWLIDWLILRGPDLGRHGQRSNAWHGRDFAELRQPLICCRQPLPSCYWLPYCHLENMKISPQRFTQSGSIWLSRPI